MTLPASGNPISLGQVNTELGRSSTATISLGDTAVRTLFGVASGAISMSNGLGKSNLVPGQSLFTTPGVYSFTVPTGCTSLCVAIAAGGGGAGGSDYWYGLNGGGGGGAGAAHINNVTVTPGASISFTVGYGGARGISAGNGWSGTNGDAGTASSCTVAGITAYGGGGGGGADGGVVGTPGPGGTATGGTAYTGNTAGDQYFSTGAPGGTTAIASTCYLSTAGKGGNSAYANQQQAGNNGAVRFMWGAGRAYPSTNTADQ